jgi:hypothetical protein
MLLLWAVYFLFLLLKTLLFSLNIKSAEIPFVAFLTLNQWILPFGLWMAIVRKEIFKPVGIYKCPICGLEKTGITDHIRGKHGEKALNSQEVRSFLESEEIV